MTSYRTRPDGVEGLVARIEGLQTQIDALRSASTLTSAVVGRGGITTYNPDTGGRMLLADGQIKLWPRYDTEPGTFGRIYSDTGSSLNYTRIYPPKGSGSGEENSFTLRGRDAAGGVGQAWLYTDGAIQLNASQGTYIQHSTTSASANAVLAANGFLQRSTSSRRYKQGIRDAVITAEDALRLRPRTWRDRAEVSEEPTTEQRYIGFIAEELDEVESLRQFVVYDEEGRPDAVQYDRISAALAVLAQRQEGRITSLESRLSALEAAQTSSP